MSISTNAFMAKLDASHKRSVEYSVVASEIIAGRLIDGAPIVFTTNINILDEHYEPSTMTVQRTLDEMSEDLMPGAVTTAWYHHPRAGRVEVTIRGTHRDVALTYPAADEAAKYSQRTTMTTGVEVIAIEFKDVLQ